VSAPPALTLHRRVGGADPVRHGRQAPYRALTAIDGEPHVVREDLLPGGPGSLGAAGSSSPDSWRGAAVQPLLCLAHVTDLQLADVQSPARFEFFNREWADPRFSLLVPVQRPQEALTPHAVDATIRTLNRLAGTPLTGAPLDLVVTTGDAIDNAQWNELRLMLSLFDGGLVQGRSGGPRYEGVQSVHWPDDVFWRPDGHGPTGPDLFRADYGFPHLPGLLERALDTFRSGGLDVPWLACFGNHEGLIQGVGAVTGQLHEALVSGRKPVRLAPHVDRDSAYETFVTGAHAFLDGDHREIAPDPDRRPVTRQEFVEAHFGAAARPRGHGFEQRNRVDGTAYYAYDLGPIRFIALDTTCLTGGADGGIDRDQLRWLEDQLAQVHRRYQARDGSVVQTGNDDRLVVLFSHHGIGTLTNRRDPSVVGAAELEAVLHRFPNLVLWLNGHTHTNGVQARPNPDQPGRGFWEVTTCAVVDWPCQTRLVELVHDGRGRLAVVCTMLDFDAPLSPGSLVTRPQLSALHRELAANVPWAGLDSPLAGTAADRNVILPMAAPFPLAR